MIRNSLLLATAGLLALSLPAFANIENGSYTPGTGCLVFTGPESPMQEVRYNNGIVNGVVTPTTSYDVTAIYNIPDPSAKLYITRTFQNFINPLTPSAGLGPVTITQDIVNFGSIPQGSMPITQDLGNFTPLSQGPGVETWSICYGPANKKTAPVCLGTSASSPYGYTLTVYPASTANISNGLVLGSMPTALTGTFNGDAPRANIKVQNTVPGGTVWVALYAGSTVKTPATSIPVAGNYSYENNTSAYLPQLMPSITMDTGNCMPGPGTYTLQVLQNSAYGVETLAAATFTVTGYQMSSTFGK
jgi:hypothetical protein